MTASKPFLIILAIFGWFGLIAQFVLHMKLLPENPTESLVRFFTFFTILTNLLVALLVTNYCITPASKRTGMLFHSSLWTATTIYIVFVGIIYNTLLRNLWKPTGLQALVDLILHTIIPLCMLFYWWIWINKSSLRFIDIPVWALYPCSYCIIVLIRGNFSKWYPYPFFDMEKSGFSRVLVNCFILLFAFLIFSVVLVYIGKRKPTLQKSIG